MDTEMFMEHEFYRDAKRMCCDRCPVQFHCFAVAVDREEFGTWGGVWFGHNVRLDARSSDVAKRERVGGTSKRMIERHARTLMKYLGITTEEYVQRYGPPGAVRAFRKAVRSLRKAEVA